MERINGRRKRAKKLIEIDELNEQVLDLTDRNNGLITANEALKEKISSLKSALQGQGDLQQALQTATALLDNHDHSENNQLAERKPAPPPQQEPPGPEIIGRSFSTEQGNHRHSLLQPGTSSTVAVKVLSSSPVEQQVQIGDGGDGGSGVRGLVRHQDQSVRGSELLALLRRPPAEAAPLILADRANRHQGLNNILGGYNGQEFKSDDQHSHYHQHQHQQGMPDHPYHNQNPNMWLNAQQLQPNDLVSMPQIVQHMMELQQLQQQQQFQQQQQLQQQQQQQVQLMLQQIRPTGGLDDQHQATSILNFLRAQPSETAAAPVRQPTLDELVAQMVELHYPAARHP